jgi:hypothetical protein
VVVGVPATDKARLSAGLGWNVAGVSHPLTDPAVELFLQFPVEFLEGLHPLTEITVIREMTVIDRDRVFPCLLFQQVLMCLDVVTDLIDHFTLPDVLVLEMLKLGEDVTRRIPLRDLLQAVLEYADLIAVELQTVQPQRMFEVQVGDVHVLTLLGGCAHIGWLLVRTQRRSYMIEQSTMTLVILVVPVPLVAMRKGGPLDLPSFGSLAVRTAKQGSFPVLDGNVIPFGGSGVDLAWTTDRLLVLHHLLPLRDPPGKRPRANITVNIRVGMPMAR